MKSEYKRDSNRNYLIFHESMGTDEDSYQLRMLTGNTMDRLLPCHVRRLNGELLLCYDVTSKQDLESFYEGRKLGGQELYRIFEGCAMILEEMGEYLLPQEQLLLDPAYIFLEAEKKRHYFCCIPGYDRESGQQFRELMEYLLPKIDHKDATAVELGYGIYRKAMGERIPLEEIREGLSRFESGEYPLEKPEREKEKEGDILWPEEEEKEHGGKDHRIPVDEDREQDQDREGRDEEGRKSLAKKLCDYWPELLTGIVLAVLLSGFLILRNQGYLQWISVEHFLGAVLFFASAALLLSVMLRNRKRNKAPRGTEEEEAYTELARFKGYEEEWERQREGRGQTPFSGGSREMEEEEDEAEEFGETVMLYREPELSFPKLVGKGDEEGKEFLLNRDVTVIGKLKGTADVVLSLPSVSRVHARIRRKEEGYYLSDLNSRNGTYLNGSLLEAGHEVPLKNQDVLRLAEAEYIFEEAL